MNFGRACDNAWWSVCGILLAAIVLWILYRKDAEFGSCESRKIKSNFLFLCNFIILIIPSDINKEPWYIQNCFLGMFIYLLVAGVMDCRLQMVSDFLHGIGLVSAGVFAFCSRTEPEVWWSFLVFCLIQYFIFRRMYGPADVAMFMVCALFLAADGRDMEAYLLHMLLTFLMLGIVQAFRGNIAKRGNLKEPVALVPYIAISFFVII